MSNTPSRSMLSLGTEVKIIQKQDQYTGKLIEGKVKKILTSSKIHPHGIKVKLEDGTIGRVQNIV